VKVPALESARAGTTHDAEGRYFLPLATASRQLGLSWAQTIKLARRGRIIARLDEWQRWWCRVDSVARYRRRHGTRGTSDA
jgi:hypothetical protein